MKRIVLLLLGLLLALPQFAQERKYSTFYEQRATLFEELPVTSKDIIFFRVTVLPTVASGLSCSKIRM